MQGVFTFDYQQYVGYHGREKNEKEELLKRHRLTNPAICSLNKRSIESVLRIMEAKNIPITEGNFLTVLRSGSRGFFAPQKRHGKLTRTRGDKWEVKRQLLNKYGISHYYIYRLPLQRIQDAIHKMEKNKIRITSQNLLKVDRHGVRGHLGLKSADKRAAAWHLPCTAKTKKRK